MKRFLALLATGALALGLSSGANAQTRGFAAGAFIMDDLQTPAHTVSLTAPVFGSAAWLQWQSAGFPNLQWSVPVPPANNAQAGFVYTGPLTGGYVPHLAYWVPPGVSGFNNNGGYAGAWDYATTAQLGIVSGSGTPNQITKWNGAGTGLVNSGFDDNGSIIHTNEFIDLGNSSTQGVLRMYDAGGTLYTLAPSLGAMEINNNFRILGAETATGTITANNGGAGQVTLGTSGTNEISANDGTLNTTSGLDVTGSARFRTSNGSTILLEPTAMSLGDYANIVFQDPDGGTTPVELRYFDNTDPSVRLIGGSLQAGTAGLINFRVDAATGNTTDAGSLDYESTGTFGASNAVVLGTSTTNEISAGDGTVNTPSNLNVAGNALLATTGGNRVGVGITAPNNQLANATSNVTDNSGDGLNGNSLNWQIPNTGGGGGGYVAGFMNNDIGSVNPHGLLVKTASTLANTRVFTANAGGSDYFQVWGNGNVNMGVNTATSTTISSQTVATPNIGSVASGSNVLVLNGGNITKSSLSFPTGSGTLNTIPKWTPSGTQLGDSKLTDDGTTLSYNAGTFAVDAATGSTTIGSGAGTGITVNTGGAADLTINEGGLSRTVGNVDVDATAGLVNVVGNNGTTERSSAAISDGANSTFFFGHPTPGVGDFGTLNSQTLNIGTFANPTNSFNPVITVASDGNPANNVTTINGTTKLASLSNGVAHVTAGNGTLASSAVVDGDLAGGVYASITGLGAQSQALNMNSNQINGVSAPTLGTDAANKTYVDNTVNTAVNGTVNTMAKFTATNVVGNSALTDNGTTLSYSGAHINTATDYQIGGTTVVKTPGTDNTFVGANAGTAGAGSGNTAIGTWAGATLNASATANIAIGEYALMSNSAGTDNTVVGEYAMQSNTTGVRNTVVGKSALYTFGSGNQNTVMGWNAAGFTTGDNNVAVGLQALQNNTGGSGSTAIGSFAGFSSTGSNNTFLGMFADASPAGVTNATAIGNGASVGSSNTVQLGNGSVTNVNTSGRYTTTAGVTLSGAASTLNLNGSVGSSGDVLTSAGAGATPTWVAGSSSFIQNQNASAQTGNFWITGAGTLSGLTVTNASPTNSAMSLAVTGGGQTWSLTNSASTGDVSLSNASDGWTALTVADGSGYTTIPGTGLELGGDAAPTLNQGKLILHDLTGGNGNTGTVQTVTALGAPRTYTLPDASGTVALTSDLTGYLPLSGGTMSGNIAMGSNSVTGVNSIIGATLAINNNSTTNTTSIGGGTTTGSVTIGNTANTTNFGGIEVHSYAAPTASNAVTIPAGATVVEIADDGNAGTGVALTAPASATNGQILYIHNADDTVTNGLAAVPSGATWTLVYSGGAWHHAN